MLKRLIDDLWTLYITILFNWKEIQFVKYRPDLWEYFSWLFSIKSYVILVSNRKPFFLQSISIKIASQTMKTEVSGVFFFSHSVEIILRDTFFSVFNWYVTSFVFNRANSALVQKSMRSQKSLYFSPIERFTGGIFSFTSPVQMNCSFDFLFLFVWRGDVNWSEAQIFSVTCRNEHSCHWVFDWVFRKITKKTDQIGNIFFVFVQKRIFLSWYVVDVCYQWHLVESMNKTSSKQKDGKMQCAWLFVLFTKNLNNLIHASHFEFEWLARNKAHK